MPDAPQTPEARATVERLMRETGITEAEARDLVTLLGADWSSLIREANVLKKR